jgi:hypothetical protein
VLAVAGGVVAYLATRTETGAGPPAAARSGDLAAVPLASGAADDYDPQSEDREESPEATQNAIDGNPTTIWDTESYESDFQSLGKDGVGLYISAGSALAARRLDLTTPNPGFTASVYAAKEVPEDISGWDKVSRDTKVTETDRIAIDTGERKFRHYLLWITDLGGQEKAAIQELTLYR